MKKFNLILSIMITVILIGGIDCFGDIILDSPDDIIRTSEVLTVVTDNQDGTYTYNYTVVNTSPTVQWVWGEVDVWPLIVDYEVPLNSPDDIWGISSPLTWSYEMLSFAEYEEAFGEPNPFGAPFILHWYDTDPPPGDFPAKTIAPDGYNEWFGSDQYEPSTDGFIFTSDHSPVDGPYLTSWFDSFRNIGDPPLPGGSPVGGGGTLPFSPVPEPSTMLLLIAGLIGLAGCKKKFKN